jgi:hypothetical protein
VPKLRLVAQNEWKKHPYMFFLLLVKKKTSLSRKNWKNSKSLKNASNYPNIYFTLIIQFFT